MRLSLTFLILVLVAFKAYNQDTINEVITTSEVIASSGDHFRGANVSLSWTLGETVVETFKNNECLLTQGFQQHDFMISTLDDLNSVQFNINIFPNPARQFFYLGIDDQLDNISNYKLIIFDLQGKEVLSQKLSSVNEMININKLTNNIYILKIVDDKNGFIRTFKLEKIK